MNSFDCSRVFRWLFTVLGQQLLLHWSGVCGRRRNVSPFAGSQEIRVSVSTLVDKIKCKFRILLYKMLVFFSQFWTTLTSIFIEFFKKD